MLNCLIWGTGYRGKECLTGIQSTRSALQVLAFVDNNSSMWNKEVCGIQVLSPDMVKDTEYDKVIICAKQGVESIKKQLLNEMNIPENKIIRYRIDPLPMSFEVNAADVYLAQLGEFGYEMISWIPYLTYLKAQGIHLKTVGRKGSSVFYENISDEHIEVEDKYIGNSGTGDLAKIEQLKKDTGLPIFGPCKERSGFSHFVNGIEWQVHDIHSSYPTTFIKKPNFPMQDILKIKNRKKGYRGLVTINNKRYLNEFAGLVNNFFVKEELDVLFDFLNKKGFLVVYNCSTNLFIEEDDQFKNYLVEKAEHKKRKDVLYLEDYSDGTEDKWDRMQLECWQNSDFVIQPPGGAAAVVELLGIRKFNLMRNGDYQDDIFLEKLYGGQSDTFYEVRHMLAYIEKEMEQGRI